VKIYQAVSFLAILAIFFTACATAATPTEQFELPPIPTPDVPPIPEIDAAIERWESSETSSYFAEIEERIQDERWKIRLQVVDNHIRAAQRIDLFSEGAGDQPVSLPLVEAEAYTVDSVLHRIRNDALGLGQVQYNMTTAFEQTYGYPLAVLAESLPSYTIEGNLVLNREHSYDLTMIVRPLMEDTHGIGKDQVFSLIRSGGPEAWCDNLRIFSDSTSLYGDDCRDDFLQMTAPDSRMELLDELRSNFANLDDTRTENDGARRLIIEGTGEGAPDAETLEQAWKIAGDFHGLLSEPIGLGLVMGFTYQGEFLGFDVFNKIQLPSQLTKSGPVRGARLSPDGKFLAFSDDVALNLFDVENRETAQWLSHPEDGYYRPRSWAESDHLLVTLIPEGTSEPIQHGWVALQEKTWHPLPTPEGVPGYGCDTGASWSSEGYQLAITGLDYGEACNSSPGLVTAEINSSSAQTILAPTVSSGIEDGSELIAGAHTPAWSPDDSWIAFGLDQDATDPLAFPTRLYRIHPDGTNLTPLTSNTLGQATSPVWAEDNSLYYALSGAGADLDGLYYYLPAENTHTLLIPGSGIHPLSISPDGEYLAYEQDSILNIWQVRLQETIAEIAGEDNSFPSFSGWTIVERDQ
jgi:hypothetical protein